MSEGRPVAEPDPRAEPTKPTTGRATRSVAALVGVVGLSLALVYLVPQVLGLLLALVTVTEASAEQASKDRLRDDLDGAGLYLDPDKLPDGLRFTYVYRSSFDHSLFLLITGPAEELERYTRSLGIAWQEGGAPRGLSPHPEWWDPPPTAWFSQAEGGQVIWIYDLVSRRLFYQEYST